MSCPATCYWVLGSLARSAFPCGDPSGRAAQVRIPRVPTACEGAGSHRHEHFNQGKEGIIFENFQRIWLFVLAITLHNFPEGLSVGVGFGDGNISSGLPLAIGIGLQNIPEGLVVALALRELDYSIAYAFGVSLLTGLVEPVGGIFGATVVSFGQSVLPWGMAAAAGAMLFVIVDEIIPEIDRESIAQEGTLGIMTGFVSMMFLDIAFG